MLGEGEIDGFALVDRGGEDAGQVGVDAQSVDGLHVEELGGGVLACAGVDELADVYAAGGDDAVEGRVDLFKGGELLEALHVGLGGFDLGGGGCGLVDEGVGVLLGDGVGFDEVLVAVGLDVGVVGVGFGGVQVGLGLGELLIDFG